MSLQIPGISRGLRRLLLLGAGPGIWRSYSTGDRRRRVIREARDEEEDEAFLRTLNFGADPENNPLPPPPRGAGGSRDSSAAATSPTDILRRAAAKQHQQQPRPEGSAQKAIGESLMEKLKLGDAASSSPSSASASLGSSVEGQQPEHEPGQPPQSEDADEIFRKMKETGLIPNAVAMLDGLCKSGLVQEAMKLFGLMREKGAIPEVVIYTAVVEAFCKAAKLDAVGFCVEMFEAGHSPNAATFVGLVDAVCKTKGIEEGEKLVRSFQDRNFAIDEKSIREHLDKKGPFSPVVWEVIFGKKKSSRPF